MKNETSKVERIKKAIAIGLVALVGELLLASIMGGVFVLLIVITIFILFILGWVGVGFWIIQDMKSKKQAPFVNSRLSITKVDEEPFMNSIKSERTLKSESKALPEISLASVQKKEPEQKIEPQKGVDVKTAFGYKGATILYKAKIENSISAPIADIKVTLFVPSVFLLLEKEKSLALLKHGESKTVTFEIRPTGECGDCEVSGKVTYYDTGSNRTEERDIESKMLSIVCPMLKVKEISEAEWHNMVSNLVETEENTKEIDIPAETLFTMVSRIIKDMHMHALKPEITQSQRLLNGVARFYGEGVKGLRYAAQVEVVGGVRRSKLILKAWAEKEDALTGFYHGILDEIEKRINVKGYIDEPIVQHFNIAGHYITGQVGRIIDVGDKNIRGMNKKE